MTEAEIYEALDAASDAEILEHFPKRYLDLKPTPIQSSYTPDQEVVVFGTITDLRFLRTPISIIRFNLKSGSASFSCAIFNQPFYTRSLREGKRILIIAKFKVKTGSFIVKTVINEDSEYLKTGIKPLYSLPKGLSQNSFSCCVRRIIAQRGEYIHDRLPPSLIAKYRLESRLSAFEHVHLPKNHEDLKRGLRVFKYEEALRYCLSTAIIRRARTLVKKLGAAKIDRQQLQSFIRKLPYALTSDQKIALGEITDDLDSSNVMYRLLQGDVGTGKTLVALLAVYANKIRGGQSAILAPTQILAAQHLASAKEILESSGVRIAFFTGKLKAKKRREISAGLEDGSLDLVIGTHALLGEKIKYKNLSLAIIDEQQNFGVKQRNTLIKKGLDTDLLMMTATPIPRTLSKVVNADIDVSTLREFPKMRRAVVTKVVQSMDPMLDRAIRRALKIHRQVFVVAPKIVEQGEGKNAAAETVFAAMARAYGEENVALLHGRMKEEDKNLVYQDFLEGRRLILVATSIVEVGLDVQSACLMIIYSANTFGLSSLHQLRGRIGRSGESALALLVYDGDEQDAAAALNYLAAHDDGLEVASYDLEHRGAGSLGGINQSGASDLQVANFVRDRNIFNAALDDSHLILTHLDRAEFRLYYDEILRDLDGFNLD